MVSSEWEYHFVVPRTSVSRNLLDKFGILTCGSQSAVVRGAALRGLEGLVPRVKRARKHYGVGLNMPFREGKDPEEKAYVSRCDDQRYCRDRIKWLIAKVCSREPFICIM